MRKEFKNAKTKHGLNSKKWKRRQISIRPNIALLLRPNMALLLRPKYLLVYNIEGRAQMDRRRGRREEEKRRKRRRRRRKEKKEEGRGVQGRFKGMESNI